jgi:hypothetical protein
MEKISKADMERFHGIAETTLRRSGSAFFNEEFARALQCEPIKISNHQERELW